MTEWRFGDVVEVAAKEMLPRHVGRREMVIGRDKSLVRTIILLWPAEPDNNGRLNNIFPSAWVRVDD